MIPATDRGLGKAALPGLSQVLHTWTLARTPSVAGLSTYVLCMACVAAPSPTQTQWLDGRPPPTPPVFAPRQVPVAARDSLPLSTPFVVYKAGRGGIHWAARTADAAVACRQRPAAAHRDARGAAV